MSNSATAFNDFDDDDFDSDRPGHAATGGANGAEEEVLAHLFQHPPANVVPPNPPASAGPSFQPNTTASPSQSTSSEVEPRRRGRRRSSNELPPQPDISPDALNLRSWLETQRLSPGVCHFSLERLAPAEWGDRQNRMIPILGIVEEKLHYPVDESYIIEKWGGHVWEVKIIKRTNTGTEKVIARRVVNIASTPVAYMQGRNRIAFDPDNDTWVKDRTNHRDDDDDIPPNRNGNGFWNGNGRGGFPPSPFGSGIPFANLEGLTSANRRHETEVMNTVLKAVSSGQEKLERAQSSAIQSLEKQVSEAQRQGMEPATRLIQSMQDQIAGLTERYETTVKHIREVAQQQSDTVRNTYESNLRLERETYKAEIDRRDTMFRQEQERRDRMHANEISALDSRWKSIVDTKDKDVERYQRAMTERESTFKVEIDRTTSTLKSDRDRDVATIREMLQREIVDLNARHAQALQYARDDADRRVTEADRRCTDAEKHFVLIKDQLTSDKSRTEAELAAAREELITLRAKANPDLNAQLANVASLKSTLTDMGMVPSSEPEKEPDAKDMALKQFGGFLGAVADRFRVPQQPQVIVQQSPVMQPQQPMQTQYTPPAPMPIQAAPIQTRPAASQMVAQQPVVPPPNVSQPNAIEQQVVGAFRQFENQRASGMTAEVLADTLMQSVPHEVLRGLVSEDPEQLIQIAVNGGVESAGTPAARRYFDVMRKVLAAKLNVQV